MTRVYNYVGPADIRARVSGAPNGSRIDTLADLLAWARLAGREARPDGLIGATFVVSEQGELLLAERRSEHVACTGGEPVLSAGEIFLGIEAGGVEVVEASNQSTGYCPEPESWPAVASGLDRLGVTHPGAFTAEVVFRSCEGCGERNVVKDDWFVCGACGEPLPREWNFG